MKKLFCAYVCTVLFLLCVILTGCGENRTASSAGMEPSGTRPDTLSIVTTIFPEYDWVREILGENPAGMKLTLLMDSGTDLHNYQPTVDDMVKISTCDLFIYAGGESDKWVPDALSAAVNQNMTAISLLEALGDAVKEEELVPGMQSDEPDEEESGYDEHVWLSLKNARTLCGTIAGALCTLDPEHAALYRENLPAYQSRLDALDTQYQNFVSTAPVKTLLFGDRFPFRYLTDDYGLTYYAAFSGCSAETEASFETVVFLADKVDELNLPAVLTIDSSDGRIARAIVDSTSAKSAQILQMDSLQSTNAQDMENGATYLGAMEKNLDVLKTALTPEK